MTHLLLGILRKPANVAVRFLLFRNLDLQKARQVIAMLPNAHVGDAGRFGGPQIGLASSWRRRFWTVAAGQLALLILFGIGVAKSAAAGRYLLLTAAIWCGAVVAWLVFGRRLFSFLFIRISGKHSRPIAVAGIYAAGYLYQLFLFGWFITLGVGIYRVALR